MVRFIYLVPVKWSEELDGMAEETGGGGICGGIELGPYKGRRRRGRCW